MNSKFICNFSLLFCSFNLNNLQSCVNVVLDFISPENVTECIQLIDELRLLPSDHKAKANKFEVSFIIVLVANILVVSIFVTWSLIDK